MKFADCEKWLWERIDAGVPIGGVEFCDVDDIQLPSRLPRNSVAWPKGWLDSEKVYWRAMMELPGVLLNQLDAEDCHRPVWNWWKRYLDGKARERVKGYRRQILRWLVGMNP